MSLTDAGVALLEEARRALRQTEVARQAARGATERTAMRLRIGYLPDTLPAAVPRALRQLTVSLPAVEVDLESAPAWRLADAVRRGRLDAAITSLPAPTNGLRSMPLGEQGAVVALPAMHPHAVVSEIAIKRLAPERLIVLPYEANPAFRNAVVAMCHAEGLAPTFVEVAEPRVEHALLAVAAGCGPAILPESVTDRYATPGVRFVALADAMVSVRTVVLTQPDNGNLATAAFLRALERATTPRAVEPSRRVVSLSARSGGPDDRADANLIARARRVEPHPAARAEASEGAARASRRTAMSDRRHLGVA